MNKLILASLALLLAGAAAAAAWLLLSPDPVDSQGAVAAPSALGPGAPGAETVAPLATPGPTGTEPAELAPVAGGSEVVGSRVGVEEPKERLFGDWSKEETRWVEGRVEWPSGAPADETVLVLAFRREVGPADVYGSEGIVAKLDEEDAAETPGLLASHPVEADGSFRLPYPAELERGWVAVSGRFLYSKESQGVDLRSEEPVVIRPGVGAWVTGRVRVPPEAEGDPEVLAGLKIRLEYDPTQFSFMDLGEGWTFDRMATIDPDLSFELRGVVTKPPYQLVVSSDDLATHQESGIRLAEGKEHHFEVELLHGGTIEGRVVDEQGRPVEGAGVRASAESIFGFPGRPVRRDDSAEDGTFVLEHVTPGALKLVADHDGYLDSASVEVELADGELVTGTSVVLEAGRRIAGHVRYPDGTPAAGAEVDVSFDPAALMGASAFNAARGAEGEGESGDDGSFAVSGLGNGPFVVSVEAEPPPGGDGDWTARRAGVRPDGEPLELVVEASPSLRGIVLAQTGEPVTEFRVTLQRDDTGFWIQGDTRHEDFEDETGSFEIEGLYAGPWKVSVSAEGHATTEGGTIDLPEPAGTEPLVVVLSSPAIAAGRVLGPEGSPVEGATVSPELDMKSRIASLAGDSGRPMARSGPDGAFELGELSPGTIQLVASHPDFAGSEAVVVEIAAGARADGLVLELRLGGTLTGQVFGEDGDPAGGVTVVVQDTKTFLPTIERTDPDGFFRREGLEPGSYQVIAMMGSFDPESMDPSGENDMSNFLANMRMDIAEVKEGEVTHVVLGAPPADPVKVHGRITHGGEGVSKSMVSFFPDGAESFGAVKFTQSDAEGEYELLLDQPGAYLVQIQSLGMTSFEQNSLEFAETVPEDVEEHELSFQLPMGRISGRVIGPDHEPVSGARITLGADGGIAYGTFMGGQYVETTTGDDGHYEIGYIRPGVYSIAVGGTLLGGAFGGDAAEGRMVRSGISLKEGQWIRDLDFRLERSGRIQGRVVDLAGSPVAKASIFVRTAEGSLLERFTMITSDTAGGFEYTGLAPGGYTVNARTQELASAESEEVRVEENQTSSVVLTLDAGTILRVSVIDKRGNQVRARVSVTDSAGREVNGMIGWLEIMESTGRLYDTSEQSCGPLPPGRYVITVFAEDGRTTSKPVNLTGQAERRLKIRLK